MIRRTILLAGLFVVGFAAGGCQQVVAARVEPMPVCNFNALMAVPPPGAPAPAHVSMEAGNLTEMPVNSVSITDAAITNKVMVQSANARRQPTGTVEVWTRLVNCTDFPLQIEGRTHFLDEGQAPVEEASAWVRLFLSPRSYGVYKESSIDVTRVRSYYVEIREGR
jgi:hypothetical protein